MSTWAGLKTPDGPDTFVVSLALRILGFLSYLTIARWVALIVPISWFFVDVWVIAWTLIAFASYTSLHGD